MWGLLTHREYGSGQPHPQAGSGSHFGPSRLMVRAAVIKDFL